MQEAISLVEKSKIAAQDIEEFFTNEMLVLNNDKRLSNHKRHKRFAQLVEKVVNSKTPVLLEGEITGSNMLWTRARFE